MSNRTHTPMRLQLTRVPNGGWLIEDANDRNLYGNMPNIVGAYSTQWEMVQAVKALTAPVSPASTEGTN